MQSADTIYYVARNPMHAAVAEYIDTLLAKFSIIVVNEWSFRGAIGEGLFKQLRFTIDPSGTYHCVLSGDRFTVWAQSLPIATWININEVVLSDPAGLEHLTAAITDARTRAINRSRQPG